VWSEPLTFDAVRREAAVEVPLGGGGSRYGSQELDRPVLGREAPQSSPQASRDADFHEAISSPDEVDAALARAQEGDLSPQSTILGAEAIDLGLEVPADEVAEPEPMLPAEDGGDERVRIGRGADARAPATPGSRDVAAERAPAPRVAVSVVVKPSVRPGRIRSAEFEIQPVGPWRSWERV
jgi:hypothetical protein